MEVDIRKHEAVREDVRAGIAALRVQGRQIWGDTKHTLPEIVLRLMVGVGDLARIAQDGKSVQVSANHNFNTELKKELDPLECLDLAINAQEAFAKSGRPR